MKVDIVVGQQSSQREEVDDLALRLEVPDDGDIFGLEHVVRKAPHLRSPVWENSGLQGVSRQIGFNRYHELPSLRSSKLHQASLYLAIDSGLAHVDPSQPNQCPR